MAIIETDPRVQALFDENTAATRRANVETSAVLKADQDRLAAETRAREERFSAAQAELKKQSEEVAKPGEKPKKPQWEQKDRSVGEMAFGPEDEDEQAPLRAATPPPPPPVAPPPPPPPARPAHRRPAPRDDDDDDLSGQTWLS